MNKINGSSLMNGNVYKHQLGQWVISWETKDFYRHWCIQKHSNGKFPILVIMLNPGSLSGQGENLTKDTTLEVLREVFEQTTAYPIIVNLFDFCTPNQERLFKNWKNRDSKELIYDIIDYSDFAGVIYAYGSYEDNALYRSDILERIDYIKSCVHVPEIVLPLNNDQSPKHPLRYRREKLTLEITTKINEFLCEQAL